MNITMAILLFLLLVIFVVCFTGSDGEDMYESEKQNCDDEEFINYLNSIADDNDD